MRLRLQMKLAELLVPKAVYKLLLPLRLTLPHLVIMFLQQRLISRLIR
nr:MAG TPA: hypothetical protein [Caudoviricetes sp.]